MAEASMGCHAGVMNGMNLLFSVLAAICLVLLVVWLFQQVG